MSAIAEDVFSNDTYQAPKAQLIDNNQAAMPYKWNSHYGRIGVLAFHARMLMLMGMITGMMIALTLVFIGVMMVFGPSFQGTGNESSGEWLTFLPMLGTLLFLSLTIRPYIVLTIKRLHDIGLSGWHCLHMIIPIFGSLIFLRLSDWHYFQMIFPIYGTLFFLYISLKTGSDDENQFGAHRSATRKEKIGGIVGFVLIVPLMVFSVAANVYWIWGVVGSL